MDVREKVLDLFGNDRTHDDDGILNARFGVVPFSVLSAREAFWQKRKREWIKLGIKGEEGRQPGSPDEFYENNAERCGGHGLSESQERLNKLKPRDAGRCFGQDLIKGENEKFGAGPRIAAEKGYGFAGAENSGLDEKTQRALGVYAATNGAVQERAGGVAGTSVFDPVLCECMYKWFMPPGGSILDPFAGESTKGIVASFLGLDYTGIELRQGQVDTNNAQWEKVSAKVKERDGRDIPRPTWLQGDSSQLSDILDAHDPFATYDFIWTSPPYYDLEIYSASEKDGSAFETYEKFIGWYKDIFGMAAARLKDNRFLAVKVGEIRDDSASGHYRNFEWDNIRVFEELGLRHYNRIVHVSPVGSLPVRIAAQFPTYRKVGNTHQMVYLFWKGPKSTKCLPEEFGVLDKSNIDQPEQKQ